MFAAALAVFVLGIFGLEFYRGKKEEKNFIEKLYRGYLKLSDRKYPTERFEKMDSFYRRHPEEWQIDDITWNDLGMDELFKRMNYTLSATGEEYLYYRLRTLRRDREELERFEQKVRFFGEHPDERVRFQFRMNKLGHTGKYSLYDYIDNLDYLGERSNRKHICMDLLFLPLAALCTVNFSLGLIGIVALMIYNIISYFKEKGEIDPYIISFAYVIRLLDICDELEKTGLSGCEEELEQIRFHKKKMQAMRRNSFWVMNSGSARGGNASGDIIGVLLDYIRMVFHVDLMKFNNMLSVLREHVEDVDGLIAAVGYLETAVAVWIFRESLTNGWCCPEFTGESAGGADRESTIREGKNREEKIREGKASSGSGREGKLELENGYHPLLDHPVKNSITAERGVLLTGSNASGKSTFLKTVALNAILAQTIHTCAADGYRGCFYRVYSSMALRDDLAGGESYYIVEIKALKRILDAAASGGGRILCFVDEVLRGTNTVERIAASNQILKSLGGSGIVCFAATHDIELTELLREDFDNYHFEEDVRDGDISFNYRLQTGKATGRNAIRLLELLGYDGGITDRASRQAERFLITGSWK